MSELREHSVERDGVTIRCKSVGSLDAPMILLLHGFPARWSTWRDVMTALADAGFLAVAPDLRGYGESDKPLGVESYSVPKIVDDVVAIVHAFDKKNVCVAGHDFGGGVAWAMTMLKPELVSRLATLNSVHPVGFERQMKKLSQVWKSWYLFFFQLPWLPEWWLSRNDFNFVRKSLADDGLTPQVIDDLMEGIRPPGALAAAINWYRATFRDGVKKRNVVAKVDVPTLAIWGDRERHLDSVLATPPEDWVSHVRVEHVPEGSHWVHHDAPKKVSALLIEHFKIS